MSTFIVCIGHEPFAPFGQSFGFEDVGFHRAERVSVEATSEQAALTIAAIGNFPGLPMWAHEVAPAHVHVSYESQDCDGRYSGSSVRLLPTYAERRGCPEGGYSERERMGFYVADDIAGNLAYGIEFHTSMQDARGYGNESITVDEPTDEGGRSTVYWLCDDQLCDEVDAKPSFRDFSAEAMGY
jgi:hypothetical protein